LAGRVQDASDNGGLLTAMRESFLRRDFEETLAAFQQMTELGAPRGTSGSGGMPGRHGDATRIGRAPAPVEAAAADDYTKPIHPTFWHAFLISGTIGSRSTVRAGRQIQEAQREK
jgi:hypothetical protein